MLTNARRVYKGQSRSPNMVPFHMLGIFFYCTCAIVPTCAFEIFDFKNVVTLKSGSEVNQGHRNRQGSIRHL